MNKKLHFATNLVPLILNKQKTATWRLWDDKNISVGDIIEFVEQNTEKHFATVKITSVTEKPMGELIDEDFLGHENYKNQEEMYQTYQNYYQKPVNKNTIVKIIHFEFI